MSGTTRHRIIRFSGLISALLVCACWISPVHAATVPDQYSKLAHKLYGLKRSHYARIMQIGKSSANRPIFAIILADPDKHIPMDKRAKLFLMCGQHGDEQMSTTSMMDFVNGIANTRDAKQSKMLKKVAIAIVPVVNPDGFVLNQRFSAKGIDLNRDWQDLSQPETKSIAKFIKLFRPNVIVDEHEWTENSPNEPNWLEVFGVGQSRSSRLSEFVAQKAVNKMSSEGLNIQYVSDRGGDDDRLAHRRFSSAGISSMLIETTPSYPRKLRQRIYKELAVSLISSLSSPSGLPTGVSLVAGGNSKPGFDIAALYAKSPIQPKKTVNWYPIFAVIACLVILYTGNRHKMSTQIEVLPEIKAGKRTRISISDAVNADIPTRMKLELLKTCRLRPTDRETTPNECWI